MSGCYDYSSYNDCGYEQSWNDHCYKPKHHRPRRRHHNDCWDYNRV
jgi:hypothetical protein